MSWQRIDRMHRKMYGGIFIDCDDPSKREDIIRLIKQTFPYYARTEIATAVDASGAAIAVPRPRDQFWACVKNKLEEEA